MATYTNVRMKADSPEGIWWQNQTDRDYAMQVLIQLANQKYGTNTDLKKYSLEKMIDQQTENTQIAAKNDVISSSKEELDKQEQEKLQKEIKPLVKEKPDYNDGINQPSYKDGINQQSNITSDDTQPPTIKKLPDQKNDVSQALFGDDNEENTNTSNKEKEFKPGGFRDRL